MNQQIRSRLQGKKDPGHGADRIEFRYAPLGCGSRLASFYRDRPLSLLANHESKAHMPADIVRYLFVSAYGHEMGSSPNLSDFPLALLPDHKNVDRESPGNSIFKDRFRVQLADRQSMTVTSHIAKDGHAFIHPDPVQCRSLTVREAARLQTFPDSYVFLGSRTSQYTQVGNAVPPFLALQIADIVGEILTAAGMN
jgi:DNA (cytosine-5)-methyltransferase 1